MKLVYEAARPRDVGRILELLEDMHGEAPVRLDPIHEAKAVSQILYCVAEGQAWLAVDGATGRLAGSIGGRAGQDWWTLTHRWGDSWFYVRPEYRASRAGHELMRRFCADARARDLRIKTGPAIGGDLERKTAFYHRFGLVQVGATFMEDQ